MDRLNFFFIIVVVFACVVDGGISSTETFIPKSSTYITPTEQTDPSGEVTSMESHAANPTISDKKIADNEQTKQRHFNEMRTEELSTSFTGGQAASTEHFNREPKTSPVTQKPTTIIQPLYEQAQTTVSRDSYTNNGVTQVNKSLFPTLLSTDTSSDSVNKPSPDVVSTTYHDTTHDVETHGSRQTSTSSILRSTVSAKTSVDTRTPKKTEIPITATEGNRIIGSTEGIKNALTTDKTVIVPVTTTQTKIIIKSTELPASKSLTEIVTEQTAKADTEIKPRVKSTTSNPENNETENPSKANEMESLRRKRLQQLIKLQDGTRPINMSKLEHFDPDEVSAAEFANFLNAINRENKILREREDDLSSDHFGNVEVISMDKLVVVVCTISAAFILFIVVMCITQCRKVKPGIEPQNESMKSYILELNRKSSKASNGKVNSDTFMGIPTNNDIWRELQTLPEAPSSIISESKEVEISRF